MPDLILDSATAVRRFHELNLKPIPDEVLMCELLDIGRVSYLPPGQESPSCGCFIGMLLLHHDESWRSIQHDNLRETLWFPDTTLTISQLVTVGYNEDWLSGAVEGFDDAIRGNDLGMDYVGGRLDDPYLNGTRTGYETGRALYLEELSTPPAEEEQS